MSHFNRAGEPGVFHRSGRRHHWRPDEDPRGTTRFLQRTLPQNWRFAQQMSLDLQGQVEFLGWPDRAEVFDTYFVRQAEVMLCPDGLVEMVNGAATPAAAEMRGAIARFAHWTRAVTTSVLMDLGEPIEVRQTDQALTYLLSRDFRYARAAVRWIGRHGREVIADVLERLPGYALVILASSPSDTAERFVARDAFWSAVRRAQR